MSGDDELHDGAHVDGEGRRKTRRSGKRRQRDDQAAEGVEETTTTMQAAEEEVAEEQHVEEQQEQHEAPARQRRQRREVREIPAEDDAGAVDENAPAPVFKLRRLRPDTPVEKDFTKLGLNPLVVQALQQMNFKEFTDIQARCIPQALGGRDLLAEAKTGSGKTLAFLIPMVEVLHRAQFRARNGTGAICIGPTRELCQQIEGVLLKLTATFNGSVTFLCCIGGINRKQEGYKLAEGRMIVVATPGRLLDHLQFTNEWNTKGMLVLAVDEADRVLDNGFEQDVRDIVKLLPAKRQTFLFSATQTTRVEQLARVSLQGEPLFISLKTKETQATVETLEQGYVVCPSELRFLLLYQFIKKNADKKIIVFFSSRNSVSFHCELLNYVDVPCVAFHGKQKQHQRSATFMQFGNATSGVLLTTDVAARGLDIPRVDWIVQFDPTDDATKYIHRVGRTARAGNVGRALMFLLPSELDFLKYLHADANVAVNEYVFDLSKITDKMREQMEKLVSGNYYLRTSARTAFEGYLLAYSASQLKKVFDVQSLDLARVAKGFGLSEPPPVRLDLSESAARLNKRSRKQQNQQRVAPVTPGTTKTQWTR